MWDANSRTEETRISVQYSRRLTREGERKEIKGVGGSRVKDGGAPLIHLGAARTLANDVHGRGHLLRTGPRPTVGPVNQREPPPSAARRQSFEVPGWSHEESDAPGGFDFIITTTANTTAGK